MDIIIVRHAEALERKIASEKKISELDRPLTAAGRRQFLSFLSNKKSVFSKASTVFVSPLLRSQETAELIMKTFPTSAPIKHVEFISPDSDPQKFLPTLKKLRAKKVVLISHEPFISLLLSTLLHTKPNSIKIKKGCIVHLRLVGNSVILRNLMNPE